MSYIQTRSSIPKLEMTNLIEAIAKVNTEKIDKDRRRCFLDLLGV